MGLAWINRCVIKCLTVFGVGLLLASAAMADDCVNVGFTPTSGLFTGTLNLASVASNKTGANGCDVRNCIVGKPQFCQELRCSYKQVPFF